MPLNGHCLAESLMEWKEIELTCNASAYDIFAFIDLLESYSHIPILLSQHTSLIKVIFLS